MLHNRVIREFLWDNVMLVNTILAQSTSLANRLRSLARRNGRAVRPRLIDRDTPFRWSRRSLRNVSDRWP
jgi:hypothetical protein